jgi:hypothetical protein
VPLGYDWCDRRLVVNEVEAAIVRHIFVRYLELRSVRLLKEELTRDGVMSKVRGSPARAIDQADSHSGAARSTNCSLTRFTWARFGTGRFDILASIWQSWIGPSGIKCRNAFAPGRRITEPSTEKRCRVRWPVSCSTKVVSRYTRAVRAR